MTTEPYGKKNPFPAPVLSVRHITGEGSPKETIHIEYSLDGSGMNYIAGDALAVIPANDPSLADALIDRLGLSPDSQVPTPEGETASLKDALVHCYDITNVNKALLTKWAAASGSQELDTLLAGDKDALSDFLWGRDVLDLATEYPASFESAEAFVGILKKIMPRLYSIASSPNAHPEQVHLCVGAVRYTARDRKRGGVCSTYMADASSRAIRPGYSYIPTRISAFRKTGIPPSSWWAPAPASPLSGHSGRNAPLPAPRAATGCSSAIRTRPPTSVMKTS